MYNILVCDDDKEIVNAIEIYLSKEGYKIFKAYNGKEALDIMQKEEIHLVILDIMMPKMDGMTTASKIRETKTVPIIMLSAKGETFDKVLGLKISEKEDRIIEIPNEIKDLIEKRKIARENKQWEESDKIRDEIVKLGYAIKDTKDGVLVEKI